MKDREATTRLLVASTGLLALFLILAVAAYLGGGEITRSSQMISTDAVPGSINAYALRTALADDIRSSVQAVLADTQAERLSSLEVAQKAEVAFRKEVVTYRATIHIDPAKDKELLGQLVARFDEYQAKRTAFATLVQADDQTASLAFLKHELLPAFVVASHAAEAVIAYNNANAIQYADAITGHIQQLHRTIALVLALALICGIVLVVNLATRRQAQRELVENARRMRQILDNLPAMVGLCEPDGRLIEVNRTALEIAGTPRDDVIDRPFQRAPWWRHSPEARDRLEVALREAAEGRPGRCDVEINTASGGKLMLDFSCGPVFDGAGRVTHLVFTGIDISERKRLEQQFLRAQRMEAIGTLTGGLAHDLNNILAPMLMAASLLKLKLDSPRDHEIVDMIESGAQRGADIIRQLLTFGRGTDGVRGSVQLRHLIRDLSHLIRETFPRNIVFEQPAPVELWPVRGDATQLHQVLLNLSLNARDAMPAGGRLIVAAENVELGEAEVADHAPAKPGRYVRLTVVDTGEGIPRPIIDRIFDPFFTTKPLGKGTGLGLSSALGIVKGHDGFLTVDSEPGRGTTFRIHLPAPLQGEGAGPAKAADKLPRGQGETILVVDDEPAIRAATRQILVAHDYRVITAENGEEAVRLFVAHRAAVKLVLTDIDMPVMTGPELIRSVRVLEPGIKFLVMTGSSYGESRVNLESMVLSDILDKPCDPVVLLGRLDQMLHGAK